MTSRRSCLVVVTALCGLLGIATSASAECAWVIWRDSVPLRSGPEALKDHWFPEQAVDSHRECDAIANAKNSAESRVKEDALKTGVQRLVDLSYLCLPDTVDPRGPKGSK